MKELDEISDSDDEFERLCDITSLADIDDCDRRQSDIILRIEEEVALKHEIATELGNAFADYKAGRKGKPYYWREEKHQKLSEIRERLIALNTSARLVKIKRAALIRDIRNDSEDGRYKPAKSKPRVVRVACHFVAAAEKALSKEQCDALWMVALTAYANRDTCISERLGALGLEEEAKAAAGEQTP
jgi:hypothetical protein